MRHALPVGDNKHTEILGYRCGGKGSMWKHLDWNHWRLDGPGAHVFNAGGFYFHVRVKKRYGEGCWYRVRCFYAGGKYRGRKVVDVGVECIGKKLHWIVRTEDK